MKDEAGSKFNTFNVRLPRDAQTVDSTIEFTVPNRYSNLQYLSAGAQGAVVSADDSVLGIKVAIKKMKEFTHEKSALRALREFGILSSILHPNIIRIVSVFTPQASADKCDVYVVTEFMPVTLEMIGTGRTRGRILDHKMLSWFLFQILCGVEHFHRLNVTHRDLKPSNILVTNPKAVVKIIDFGLARLFRDDSEAEQSRYVVTRYYRAPEVVLRLKYTTKVDIWSIGCIFAELITGQVLFPGKKEKMDNQWTAIVCKMGKPSTEFITNVREVLQREDVAEKLSLLPPTLPKSLADMIPDKCFTGEVSDKNWTASYARDLIAKMLEIDPDRRCSASQALRHPYLSNWYPKYYEDNVPASPVNYSTLLDESQLSMEDLKSIVFEKVKMLESEHNVFGVNGWKSHEL